MKLSTYVQKVSSVFNLSIKKNSTYKKYIKVGERRAVKLNSIL